MKQEQRHAPRFTRLCLLAAAVIALLMASAPAAFAQVPPRFYWKTLSGANAVPVIFMAMNGNANPMDPGHTVIKGANIEATVAPVGYAHTFALFDRAAMVAVLVPMGRISGEATIFGTTFRQSASGLGDPLVEFDVNVIGKKAIRNLPDLLRYEPGFSADLLVDVAIPLGEYDDDQALNIGQNRWYGRVAAPIVWQLGGWVPGRRTTLEFLPSLWLFGDNSDFVGHTMETDPMVQVEGHLTRDFAKHLWGSLDATWITGGAATIDGVAGDELNNIAVGYTLGYQINDNLSATLGYMATVNDSDPGDLQLDGFRFSVVFGWHPLIEGMKRLGGGE
ncbi:MAG: transporter [Gemmatimonadota bacterium]|nr:transporter [Gemmatimonadota bacterium]